MTSGLLATCIIAACAALLAWALVVLDLGRKLIAHADSVEERKRAAREALDVGALDRRLTKLETAERQTANVLASRGGR